MYIETIEIKNYFSIGDEGIYLENLSNKAEMYFSGENGVGKTIFLQAVARAVKGKQTIGTVIDILRQNDRKNPVFKAKLKEKIDLFAYGINRLSIKGLREIDYKDEEVYISLFDNGRNLINPTYWLQMLELDKRYDKNNIELNQIQSLLSELLEKDVEIIFEGREVIFNEKGTRLNFNQLSDGYKSAITWISDLLARLSTKQPKVKELADYKAIVLVDEIGIYLHPKLKLELVKKLRAKFPGIQWFFTTHSPEVMLGASDDAIAYKMYKENGITFVSEPIELKNFTSNSLLTSNLWGLERFYTQNTQLEFISDVDDIYQKIYKIVKEKREKTAHLSNTDLISLIENELEKESKTDKENII